MTVKMFEMRRDIKSADSCEDRDQDHPDPCDCWYVREITNVRGVKTDVSYEDGGFEA